MNKYAIYTEGEVYPVLEKDGQYYIGVPNTGHFSGDWKFLGVRERLKNNRVIIKPEDALKITDWQFKNGSPRYQVVDLDHGTVRTWAGTADNQQLKSFDIISDNGFNLATKTDNDDEIVLEEEASQAAGVASGVNGKIDSFPINPKEMEKQRLKETIDASLIEKDFERMSKMTDIDNVKDYLYDVTMNQNYDEARNTLIAYLKQAILIKNQNIIDATKYIIDASFGGLQGLEDFFTLNESVEDGFKVKTYIVENTGGYTMVAMGQLANGKYFALSDELLGIYDEDYHQAYLDELTVGETDWEEEHLIDFYDYESAEYKIVKNQINSILIESNEDVINTLQEMALLEDYKDNDDISPQKQKFIDYCKDKIEDLGDIEIDDQQYHKLMHTEGIREFEDLYIIADLDDYESENLIAINNENKIVIDTPMIDQNGYAATMQFDKIDKRFYDILMDYWDDLYMDEMIEE